MNARARTLVALFLTASLLAACAEQRPATEVGTPMGTPASKTIGTSGGELVSGDGLLKLEVPEGALSADTELVMQPITNTSYGAAGVAYRLTPDGLKFAKPVTLRFTYTDDDVAGSSPAMLVIVTQKSDRSWEPVLDGYALDTTAKTVSITTTHFTDWGKMRTVDLVPAFSKVKVGQTASPYVQQCFRGVGEAGAGQTPFCYHLSANEAVKYISNWSVNGVTGGNSTVGTITGDIEIGRFVAPDEVPDTKIVLLTVDAKNPFTNKTDPLIARIEIMGDAAYVGPVSFTTQGMNYRLTVDAPTTRWEQKNSAGTTFKATGAFTYVYELTDCDRISSSGSFTDGELTIYPATSPVFASSYNMVARATPTYTASCGMPRMPVTLEVPIVFQAGFCSGSDTVPFTDLQRLTGGGPCAAQKIESSSWNLARVE